MRALLLSLLAVILGAGPAAAADLTVDVKSADGRPAANAVVLVRPASGAGRNGPIRFPWPYVVSQQDIQFHPYVLIAPVGADVTFPNKDTVRHHVYSFSPTKKFELKLYGHEEARTVRFDKAGVVALGCNIHDQMIAFIYVTDTPFAALTDAAGRAVLHGVPAGAAKLGVWHPDSKAPGGEVARPITVAGAAMSQAVTLDLRVHAPMRH
jgi:plastocyanin